MRGRRGKEVKQEEDEEQGEEDQPSEADEPSSTKQSLSKSTASLISRIRNVTSSLEVKKCCALYHNLWRIHSYISSKSKRITDAVAKNSEFG